MHVVAKGLLIGYVLAMCVAYPFGMLNVAIAIIFLNLGVIFFVSGVRTLMCPDTIYEMMQRHRHSNYVMDRWIDYCVCHISASELDFKVQRYISDEH